MKKSIYLLAASLAVAMLGATSCTPTDTKLHFDTVGGTEADATEINKQINSSIVLIRDETKLGGDSRVSDLIADSDDFVKFATSKNAKGKPMTFTWEIDESNPCIRKISDFDTNIKMIEFNYPKKGEAAVEFSFYLTKVEYKDCSTVEGQKIAYKFKLLPDSKNYEVVRLHEIVSVDSNGHFGKVDYSKTKPNYPSNNSDVDVYYSVETYGEVVYLSPDGDWGLVAEGDAVMEIFTGGKTPRPFITKYWPALYVGNKVLLHGEITVYMGNIQMSFINRIWDLPTSITCADASNTYAQLTATDLENIEVDGGNHKQAVDGFMNGLFKVTGKIVENTWVTYSSGGPKTPVTKFEPSKRNCFDFKVGSKKIRIAYDYHVLKRATGESSDTEEMTAFKNAMNSLCPGGVIDTTTEFTISGTLRYNNSTDDKTNPFPGDIGVWELVPFLSSHIVPAN